MFIFEGGRMAIQSNHIAAGCMDSEIFVTFLNQVKYT